jgi:hypothetical protein
MDPNVLRESMAAYQAVYNQDLREELEFKNWVNSLVEEGYDLSEYTSDELYESYLNEVKDLKLTKGASPSSIAQMDQRRKNIKARGGTLGQIERGLTRAFGSGEQIKKLDDEDVADRRREQTALKRSKDPNWKPAAKPTTDPAASKPAASTAASKPSASTSTASKPAASTSTASKPAATSAAKPAASKPATGMLGKTSFERRTPTSSELKAAQTARASGASPEKALQAAKSAGGALSQATAAASKPTAFDPSSSSSSTATAKPSAPSLQQSIRNRRLNMDLDVFDLVKGYLLDEGYAETEEGAIVMMVNMSEGWRESILESCGVQVDEAQHARENPEGHDKEEKKKYEKVRGEKTPMPPRGDKRREDFEKWYAANVR